MRSIMFQLTIYHKLLTCTIIGLTNKPCVPDFLLLCENPFMIRRVAVFSYVKSITGDFSCSVHPREQTTKQTQMQTIKNRGNSKK